MASPTGLGFKLPYCLPSSRSPPALPSEIILEEVLSLPALDLSTVDLLESTGPPILDFLVLVLSQRSLLASATTATLTAEEALFILQVSHLEPPKRIS